MKNNKKETYKGAKSYTGSIAAFVVICVLVCAFSFLYYSNLHKTIRDESKGYLQEVSRRIASNLDRIMQDNFTMLNIMAASLDSNAPESVEEIRTLLQKQEKYCNFANVLLVDDTGKAYNISDSGSVFMSFDSSVLDSMLATDQAIGTTQVVNNQEYFIFAVSLNDFYIEGNKMMALAACYTPDTLQDVLSMTAFDSQAYSQIITKVGTLVTKAQSSYAVKSGYNIFTTLQNASIDDGETLEQVKTRIQNGEAGQISFSIDGEHRYMVYTPLESENWYLLTFVPFKTVNEKSDMLLATTLRICGFIVIAFCSLLAMLFYVFNTNKKRLEQIAYVDMVTGGNTIQKFYEDAHNVLESQPEVQYALVYSNIENFKILNAQLGRKNCDQILAHFYAYAASQLQKNECIGRLFADNFCMLMEYTDEETLLNRFENWSNGAEEYIRSQKFGWVMPNTEFGVFVIDNANIPFPEMVDRAKLALREFPHTISNKLHYAFYDDAARFRLFREKQLSDMMEKALSDGEFEVYLQPKYRLPEEKIGGAEALVRWNSHTEGMIYPDEFIPLFEKNGFIVALDLWVFMETCRTIRKWIDQGIEPVKISVNCSRIHFKNEQFLQPYKKIADQYGIDRGLIEIELTESVVFENTERLTGIILDIKAAGFGCSMDDFGSGYSSLNLIQSIPVDTLKIDKVFFNKQPNQANRMEAVVKSIIRLAHSLSMVTVAEGVEFRDQVDMLKAEGCDYIQGYVFDKPMTISSFEQRAFGRILTGVKTDEENQTDS